MVPPPLCPGSRDCPSVANSLPEPGLEGADDGRVSAIFTAAGQSCGYFWAMESAYAAAKMADRHTAEGRQRGSQGAAAVRSLIASPPPPTRRDELRPLLDDDSRQATFKVGLDCHRGPAVANLAFRVGSYQDYRLCLSALQVATLRRDHRTLRLLINHGPDPDLVMEALDMDLCIDAMAPNQMASHRARGIRVRRVLVKGYWDIEARHAPTWARCMWNILAVAQDWRSMEECFDSLRQVRPSKAVKYVLSPPGGPDLLTRLLRYQAPSSLIYTAIDLGVRVDGPMGDHQYQPIGPVVPILIAAGLRLTSLAPLARFFATRAPAAGASLLRLPEDLGQRSRVGIRLWRRPEIIAELRQQLEQLGKRLEVSVEFVKRLLVAGADASIRHSEIHRVPRSQGRSAIEVEVSVGLLDLLFLSQEETVVELNTSLCLDAFDRAACQANALWTTAMSAPMSPGASAWGQPQGDNAAELRVPRKARAGSRGERRRS